MVRPPPLQLHLDNMIPDLALSRSQSKSFVSRIYQTNWRGVIIAVAVINALRFFLSAASAFQDVNVDRSQKLPQLAAVSTGLGVMYVTTCAIEIFGILGASMQRLPLIRIYAHLAFFSALLVTVAGLITAITYFVFADDLVSECTALAIKGQAAIKSTFRGDNWPSDQILNMDDASAKCVFAWTDDSWTQVFAIFLFYFLPSTLYYLLAYTYYRQATDPYHPANLCTFGTRSGRGSSIRMEAFPNAPHSPLYNASGSRQPLIYDDELAKSPRYKRRSPRNLVPKIQRRHSASPLPYRPPVVPFADSSSPYTLSPGPPSFNNSRTTYPPYNGRLAYSPAGPGDDDKFI